MQQKHAYRKQSGAIKNAAYIIRRNRREEMEIAGIAIDETVDITDKVCPLKIGRAHV